MRATIFKLSSVQAINLGHDHKHSSNITDLNNFALCGQGGYYFAQVNNCFDDNALNIPLSVTGVIIMCFLLPILSFQVQKFNCKKKSNLNHTEQHAKAQATIFALTSSHGVYCTNSLVVWATIFQEWIYLHHYQCLQSTLLCLCWCKHCELRQSGIQPQSNNSTTGKRKQHFYVVFKTDNDDSSSIKCCTEPCWTISWLV